MSGGGITYEGAVGGGLFAGKKFWFSMRCTFRQRFIQEVQENGGTVVPLERQADILVADNDRLREPPPEGSVSWQYIDKSLKNGVLERLEDHQYHATTTAGAPAATKALRAFGSSAPVKTTRTKYTAQEEQELLVYVTRKEREGGSVHGNVIFQEFAESHPSHTWQSWKNKWDKDLCNRARLNLGAGSPSNAKERHKRAVPPPAPAPAPARPPSPAPAPKLTIDRKQPESTVASRPEGLQPTRTKLKFTEAEDRLLTNYVRECEANGRRISGNVIYKELAEEYPSHSWHSWRDRWVRQLSHREPVSSGSDEDEQTTLAQVRPNRPSGSRTQQSTVSQASKPTQPNVRQPAPAASPLPAHLAATRAEHESLLNGNMENEDDVAQDSPTVESVALSVPSPATVPSVPPRLPTGDEPAGAPLPKPASAPCPKLAGAPPPKTVRASNSEPPSESKTPEPFRESLAKKVRDSKMDRVATQLQKSWKGNVLRSRLQAFKEILPNFQVRCLEFLARRAPVPTDDEDDEVEMIKCTCGYAELVEPMITCDECGTRQHPLCYNLRHVYDGMPHRCVDCQRTLEEPPKYGELEPSEDLQTPMDLKTPKEQFYTCLNWYIKAKGKIINHWPKISGRVIDLWDLYDTVISLDDGLPVGARSWEDIAEKLGFDWIEAPDVTSQLKACYDANLAELGGAIKVLEANKAAFLKEIEDGSDEELADDEQPVELVSNTVEGSDVIVDDDAVMIGSAVEDHALEDEVMEEDVAEEDSKIGEGDRAEDGVTANGNKTVKVDDTVEERVTLEDGAVVEEEKMATDDDEQLFVDDTDHSGYRDISPTPEPETQAEEDVAFLHQEAPDLKLPPDLRPTADPYACPENDDDEPVAKYFLEAPELKKHLNYALDPQPGTRSLNKQQQEAAPVPDTQMGNTQPPMQSMPFQSSPPIVHGQKRAHEDDDAGSVDLSYFPVRGLGLTPEAVYSYRPAKRRRFTRDHEIPSTPPEKVMSTAQNERELSNLPELDLDAQALETPHDIERTPTQQPPTDHVSSAPRASLTSTHPEPPTQPEVQFWLQKPPHGVEVVLKSTAVTPRRGFRTVTLSPEEDSAASMHLASTQPKPTSPAAPRRTQRKSIQTTVGPPLAKDVAENKAKPINEDHLIIFENLRKGHQKWKQSKEAKEATVEPASPVHPRRSLPTSHQRKVASSATPMPISATADAHQPPLASAKGKEKEKSLMRSLRTKRFDQFAKSEPPSASSLGNQMPTPVPANAPLGPATRPHYHKSEGKGVRTPLEDRRRSSIRQAKASRPAPSSTAPPAQPTWPASSGMSIADRRDIFSQIYGVAITDEVMRGCSCNLKLITRVFNSLNDVKKAELTKLRAALEDESVELPTDVNSVRKYLDKATQRIQAYWREKDDIRLETLIATEGKTDRASKSVHDNAWKALVARFGADAVRHRREWLEAFEAAAKISPRK